MIGPDSSRDFTSIRNAMRAGDWDWAEAHCHAAWAREADPRVHVLLGLLAAKSGLPAAADPLLDRAFKALAPGGAIRSGLTDPVCELADPDLACRLLWKLADTHGAHPELRPRSPTPGHWSASVLAGLPGPARYWPAMNEFQVRAVSAALGCVSGPLRALEWGSGHSTLYFASKAGDDASWDSVEHDPEWLKFVADGAARAGGARIALHSVPPDAPLGHPHDDGDAHTFGKYIAFPATLERTFGFILVDGRARVECLRAGWSLLREEGIMALHDSERKEYRPGYPAGALRVALHSPALKEQTRIDFFLKSRAAHAAFARALGECLPEYVEVATR